MLPTRQLYGLAPETDCDALALDATADDREAEVVGGCSEQLVVLAEGEIVDRRTRSEGNPLQVELDPAPGATRDVAGVDRQPVRDVGQRVRACGKKPPLPQSQRGTGVALLAETQTGCAKVPGHDAQRARTRATAAREAGGAADRSHGKRELQRARGVASHYGHAGLVEPAVELEHVLEQRVLRRGERDEQRLRLGPGGGEVAQVHRRGTKAQLTVRRPVEPEVDVLDERVLRDHDAVG